MFGLNNIGGPELVIFVLILLFLLAVGLGIGLLVRWLNRPRPPQA